MFAFAKQFRYASPGGLWIDRNLLIAHRIVSAISRLAHSSEPAPLPSSVSTCRDGDELQTCPDAVTAGGRPIYVPISLGHSLLVP